MTKKFIFGRREFGRSTLSFSALLLASPARALAGEDPLREALMARIGKDLTCDYPRTFVDANADLGDPAVVEKYFSMLDDDPVDDAASLEKWLMNWSELASALGEEEAIRYINMTRQTDDPEREQAFLHFVENVAPKIKPRQDQLSRKYLAAGGLKDLPAERFHVLTRDLKTSVEIYRDENVPLQTEEEKLSQQYQKLTGGMTVNFDGREQTLQQMARYLELPDRKQRQAAWEAVGGRRLQDRAELDRLFDEMRALRQRIAKNAGFDNFRDYALKARGRFDYGVKECEQFHAAVEESVVPIYRELQERRRQRMKLDKLRPWDLRPDPFGRPPLRPFEDVKDLVAGCQKIFDRLDPELGKRFRFLCEHELMDLASRKGKAPGAYSHSLGMLRLPFIFANSVGLDYDVNTLLHECGHAFHTMECREEPLAFYRHAPLEFAEVASMGMEFLGMDHTGVFYKPEEQARSREQQLEGVISIFCWIATVDAFQHWIYTHDHNAEERAAAWLDLRHRFGGSEDWSGYEDHRRFEWHRQLHIFEIPFYYIEYGVAELGALQVWRRAEEDKAAALRDYRSALSLGGSKPLPELFRAAGIRFDMSRETIAPLCRHVKDVLDRDAKMS